MAPGKRQVKARRHLVYNHCHSLVDFAVSGCGKTWSETTEEGFTFQCLGCWKVDCLTAELARLTDIVKGVQSGGRVIARTTNGERTTGNMTCRKVTGEKVTVEKEGGTRGQEMREVDATGEATRGENVLDIVLSSQKEFVDNIKICEPLGCSDHNQIHFIIKVKGERNRNISRQPDDLPPSHRPSQLFDVSAGNVQGTTRSNRHIETTKAMKETKSSGSGKERSSNGEIDAMYASTHSINWSGSQPHISRFRKNTLPEARVKVSL
ncbi:hypothetical protein NP493_53g17003 [Ridgeia piscesae]|uniref:Uncharacterized protein n=1 Tax=Ridgeia piscesae TaxID=27915 RepID=A0AAD9UJB5_RIDPI|nr:hypothetical protein NP493_53g17003 [Ridgeia piscesae]